MFWHGSVPRTPISKTMSEGMELQSNFQRSIGGHDAFIDLYIGRNAYIPKTNKRFLSQDVALYSLLWSVFWNGVIKDFELTGRAVCQQFKGWRALRSISFSLYFSTSPSLWQDPSWFQHHSHGSYDKARLQTPNVIDFCPDDLVWTR